MSRFYGKLGYATGTVETKPGVWVEGGIIEKEVVGILLRDSRSLDLSSKINPDINLSNKLSIMADPYARENYQSIKYVKLMGTDVKWRVISVEIQYPRLTLMLGGVYNG